ncbi:hypothetical protein BDR04DRAFT_1105522 [Suillus decipiens]|nr:hypothetical protein BDR04DRAFT_1105522 [Suillus decipiens]
MTRWDGYNLQLIVRGTEDMVRPKLKLSTASPGHFSRVRHVFDLPEFPITSSSSLWIETHLDSPYPCPLLYRRSNIFKLSMFDVAHRLRA